MKKWFSPTVHALVLVYASSHFLIERMWSGTLHSLESTVIYLLSIFNLGLLLLASLISRKIVLHGESSKTGDEEDQRVMMLERLGYKLTLCSQTVFTVSLITLIAAFLLVRDTNPTLAFYTTVIFSISLVRLFRNIDLIRYIRPDFQLPNPQAKDYQKQLFNSYDDGEKYVMLKSLYKLYYTLQSFLVVLMFILMFYSVFTGVSQLFAIVAVGGILLFMQLYFTKGVHVRH